MCPALCDPVDHSMLDFPVLHHPLEFAQLVSIVSVMPSNHLILSPSSPLPSIFCSIRVFSSESALASGDHTVGASASASVFPMNIQGSFPLGLTDLTSLLSKGLSSLLQHCSSSAVVLIYGPALCMTVTIAMKSKDTCSLEEKL